MKNWFRKIKIYALKHPVCLQIIICLALALAFAIPSSFVSVIEMRYRMGIGEVLSSLLSGVLLGAIVVGAFIYPIIVTIYEVLYLGITAANEKKKEKKTETESKSKIELESEIGTEIELESEIESESEIATEIAIGTGTKTRTDTIPAKIKGVGSMLYDFFIIVIGVILEVIVLDLLHDVVFSANWSNQLRNAQLHTPINTHYMIPFVVISFLYVIGMLLITLTKKRPPLVTVLCISAMYLGVIEAIFFTIQILGMHTILESGKIDYRFELDLLYTLLIPVNMLLIMLRVMLVEIRTYRIDESRNSKIAGIPTLAWCQKILNNSKNWPVLAILMMIPLLGIIIGILSLFGQAPDAVIKAFTETADYTFSTRIPPQNIYYDEHYLCTVAAGGHRRIVKPIRMGKRHGHDVVVNRQLMIANAFEQILEERTPKIHRIIRDFYDKYGFPVARLIKSKIVADVIWLVMKPLEWLFLIIIYLLDVNPEDRIARQYL